MSDTTVKYITPPKSLRKKQIDAGVALTVSMSMIDAAEKSVGDMKDSYLQWVGADLNKLHDACEAAVKDKANRAAHVEALYNIAVEIKGQGGSFGFPLMTTIGSQLCRFIESAGHDLSDAQLDVVRIHVETLRLVIQQKMEGDGGALGHKLLTGLTLALKKVAK
ncbi:MAG: Hpt domain-containing protein [Rhodobacteraceae bacterium]|nr:Hpt domain-containing protein [Paracoccaceae bacterium]